MAIKSKNPWKTLSSKTALKNKWVNISEHKVIRPDGKKGEYFVVRKNPAVFVVSLTPKKEVYLIGLWRYPTNLYSIEVPGGGAEKQKPLVAAKRELREEAGIQAKKWQLVGKFQSFNGMSDELSYTFIAQDLSFTAENEQLEEGIAEVIKVPLKKALRMIKSGKITDGQTIASLTQVALYLKIIKT